MKLSRLAFLAAVFGACPAAASPPGDIAGTWECRLPGIEYRNKPPILYVADTGGDQSQVTIEVDGFAREIYGRSEIAADQGGWWKVKPAQGQEFMIRPDGSAKQRTPAMGLRFADSKSDYRCLRLPPSGVPSAVIPLAPAEEQGAPPIKEQGAPPMIELGVPPEPAQSEGDAPKKE
ncbi:MAG: hypothetical protein E6H51_06035 [Betaproteobacteria bacterium]|nr:MAG: hypothetical protein E6H51_06035 [Betaproteobacteria bacterium]